MKLEKNSDEEIGHIFDTICSSSSNNNLNQAVVNERNLTEYILVRIKEIDSGRMKRLQLKQQQQLEQKSTSTIEKEFEVNER